MKYKFEDIAYNVNEKAVPSKEELSNYIGLEHLISGSMDVPEYGSKVDIAGDKLVMHKGDVLFGKRNTYLRRVAIAPCNGYFSAHGMILRPKEEIIDKSFFPWFIFSDYFMDEAIRISVGSLSPTVNWKDLKVCEFELPSIEEQKMLADKLWAAYEVKQSYLNMIDATNQMVKAKFVEMLNSKKWPLVKLPDIAEYSIGLTYKPSEVTNDGVIVLRSGNIKNTMINLEDVVRVSSTAIKEDLFVRKDDILMCSRNGSAQLVGKVALIPELSEPMTYGAFMTIIRSKYNKYLILYFQTKEFRLQLSGSKSSVMNQVTQKMLNEIIVPMPDVTTIEVLASMAHQAETSIARLNDSIAAIDRVIRSLINENL